jgi:hypothetical protein
MRNSTSDSAVHSFWGKAFFFFFFFDTNESLYKFTAKNKQPDNPRLPDRTKNQSERNPKQEQNNNEPKQKEEAQR